VILDDKHTHGHSMSPGGHSVVTGRVTVASPVGSYNGAMTSHPRLIKALAVAALAAAMAILITACGTAKKPPASTAAGNSPQDNGAQDAYRYSACMRTHGVSNFQDPHVHTNGNQVQVAIHVDPAITGSPNFKSAQQACAHILPGIGTGPTVSQERGRTQAMLAFARCMRQHGFPKFPDPTAQGQLTLAMITKAGIDLQQPAVKPAAYSCIAVTHGILTRANVNQAVANPNGSGSQSGGGG
jgi:hypothetical protein